MNWSKLAPSPTSVLLLAMAFIVTMAGAVAQNTTSALFTDIAVSTDNTFTSGTLDVRLSDVADVTEGTIAQTDDNVTASLMYSNMVPGNFKARPLTIANNGTLPYSYTVSGAITDGGLAGDLTFNIASGVDASTCSNATTFVGTQIYSGTLNAATAPITTARGLAANASEVLCLQVLLPSDTTSAAAVGQTAAITLSVEAIQQRNR